MTHFCKSLCEDSNYNSLLCICLLLEGSQLEMLVGVGVTLSIMVSIDCHRPYLVLDATIGCRDFVAVQRVWYCQIEGIYVQ